MEGLQAHHRDHFQRVHALPGIIQRTFVRVPLDIVRQIVLSLRWQPMMLSHLRCGTIWDHLKVVNMICYLQQTTQHDLQVCVGMKIHYELLKSLYRQSCTPWKFQMHWASVPLICGVWHPYKHMNLLLQWSFMPIISLVEKSTPTSKWGTNKGEVYSHGEDDSCPMSQFTRLPPHILGKN